MIDVSPPIADGRYRLLRLLGAGGMASVYLAWDTRLEVERAVKILDPRRSAETGTRDRFAAEARTMARLHHPNIVAVHDTGNDQGRLYIVMERMVGGSLSDRVRRLGPLPPQMACRVVQGLCLALSAAHSEGVVHRDIKPGNILLAEDGTPKVADFGIARVADNSDLTRTGMAMGTYAFMAPEQRLNAKGADARADIYAAGATLFALVTGRDPFDLYNTELGAEQYQDVSEPLVTVIRKACSYRPEDRYSSAEDLELAVTSAASELSEDGPGPPLVVIGEEPITPPPGRISGSDETFDASSLESEFEPVEPTTVDQGEPTAVAQREAVWSRVWVALSTTVGMVGIVAAVLVCLGVGVPVATVATAIAIPSFVRTMWQAEHTELQLHMAQIQAAELAYYAENGQYLAISELVPRPVEGLLGMVGEERVDWPVGTPFDKLGFAPEKAVVGSYSVDVDGDELVIHGWINSDGNDEVAHYTLAVDGGPVRETVDRVW